jgi:hypothetical protein
MITSVTEARIGSVTVLTAVSNLSGTVYYHWYADGAYLGGGRGNTWSIALDAGETVRADCQDSNDPDYDAVAAAPAGWPARRSIFWTRPSDSDVSWYLIEEKKAAGAYAELARVPQRPNVWSHKVLSSRLDDLTEYTWRITAYDAAGNAGTAKVIGPELIVRTPEAPDFTAVFIPATTKVTIDLAA